jgi:type I restriction enzyme S subunit
MSFNSWVKYNLLDISKIHTGKSNSVDSTEYGPYPFIDRSQTIKRSLKYLYDETAILIPGEGQEFNPRYISGKYDLHQRVYAIVPDEKIVNAKFLYYLMIDNKNVLSQVAVGSTVKSLRLSSFEFLKLHIPKLSIQEEITNILSSFDDKIEVNNKINKNLEELAQTLYKHWFVDFEFPNEEGKPYKSSGGKMIESELGLIPENWTIQYLNEVLEFERGIEPGSKNYEETYKEHLVPFYRVGDMINQDKVVYVDKELTNNKIANVGDVFVSFDGALGRISNTLNGSYSTGIRKVFSKEKFLSNNFIYVLFQSADIQNTIKMYASGTTILHASSSIQYLSMPFNKDIVDKFTETISPIVDKIITNKIENIKLAEMRDLLLPKLMSGEIRLPIEE